VYDPDQDIGKIGTEGTREEEGGKENAGKPSGMDKGALQVNGEAGGTHTSPGPSVQEVERYQQTHAQWDEHARNGTEPTQPSNGSGLAVPGQHNGDGRPDVERQYSVSQAMSPHLQLM
jgi:hypothetical protein